MLFRLLGPFEVVGPSGPIAVSSARQRAVLAVLALDAGRPVPVARLVDAVWPDDPPASARNSLQSHVTRLRSVLGDPALIVLEPAGYRLAVSPDTVDVLRFEALAGDRAEAADLDQALALWRGPPLPEFPDEPFAARAARLAEAHRNALARRADLLLADGHAGDAAAQLADAVAADPCWERGTLIRARALAAGGEGAEAAAVLRRHSDSVVDRLGMDPSAAVRRLQVALLRGEIGPRGEMGAADAAGTPGTHPARAPRPGPDATGADPRISPAQAQRPGPDADAAGPRREPAGRVPLRFSSFVGRDAEQAELARLLADPGLVTVVGPGGVGKSRLVAETVRAASRIAWVDAADVRDGDDLAQAVAVAVGATGPGADPLTAVADAAARRRPLVVLDNCEHLADAAAELVEALLGASLRIVVTSRERLRVDVERVLRLGPLESAAGVRLFRDRAGNGAEAGDPAVTEIVAALDGLPLAIELAATQAAVLGVAELRARLGDRLDLFTRGRRTADARHRTLRAVLDSSFRLLDDEERLALRRLAVFAGAFSVALAEAVVADERLPRSRVAAVIADLVDRSLVARHGPRRYRLLETVRAYAAGPEAEAVRPRHAAAVVAAAEEQAERLLGPDQAAAVREIDALLADLRQVVFHADTETVGRIAGALYRYGYRRQHYEVLAWGRNARQPAALAAAATHAWGRGDLELAERLAQQAVAAGPDTFEAHEARGDVALVAGDVAGATAHYRAMAEIGRAAGRAAEEASGLVGEALVLAYSGSIGPACRLAGTALEVADASGNPSARAEARYVLGEALADTDPPRALALLDEAAALAGGVQDRLFEAAAESAAVAIRSRHGDPAAALTSFRAVLALWRQAGNDMLQAAALRNLVVLLARVGADETAALVDAALPASRLYAAERERLDRARAAVAERLGPDRLATIRRRAARMPAAGVVDAALEAIDAALKRPAG